jgi:hypothetical protein
VPKKLRGIPGAGVLISAVETVLMEFLALSFYPELVCGATDKSPARSGIARKFALSLELPGSILNFRAGGNCRARQRWSAFPLALSLASPRPAA